jgi:hypothetical protein
LTPVSILFSAYIFLRKFLKIFVGFIKTFHCQ